MRFLEQLEIDEWVTERGVATDIRSEAAVVILRRCFGQAVDPRGQEREVASATIDALGEWDECLLCVTQWGIWGSSEDWPRYYAARGTRGERRSLEKAPGHLFSAGDRAALEEFLQLTLENAWDAFLVAVRGGRSNGRRALVSHDEYAEVLAMGAASASRMSSKP